MRNSRNIIKSSLVSEKGTGLRTDQDKYIFRVDKSANKLEIKKAVEELFKVQVQEVTTMIIYGKPKRLGRSEGRQPDWKKAIVKLKKGETIELFESM